MEPVPDAPAPKDGGERLGRAGALAYPLYATDPSRAGPAQMRRRLARQRKTTDLDAAMGVIGDQGYPLLHAEGRGRAGLPGARPVIPARGGYSPQSVQAAPKLPTMPAWKSL